jgi:hypothetical protein
VDSTHELLCCSVRGLPVGDNASNTCAGKEASVGLAPTGTLVMVLLVIVGSLLRDTKGFTLYVAEILRD